MRKEFDRRTPLRKQPPPRTKPNPYRLPIGMVDGKQALAMLSQLRNIDGKRLVKKIVHLDVDMLVAMKKEADRVNFG